MLHLVKSSSPYWRISVHCEAKIEITFCKNGTVNEKKTCCNYCLFKKKFCVEDYHILYYIPCISLLLFSLRQRMLKFRFSRHKLPIHQGSLLDIARDKRMCTFICNSGETEDEFHYLLKCSNQNVQINPKNRSTIIIITIPIRTKIVYANEHPVKTQVCKSCNIYYIIYIIRMYNSYNIMELCGQWACRCFASVWGVGCPHPPLVSCCLAGWLGKVKG